jgi:hypothetical protein
VDSPQARVVASSSDGQPIALELGLEYGQPSQIDVCPGCGPLVKAGGAIRGLALLDGEVRAVVAGFGPLPGEQGVAQFAPVPNLPPPAAPIADVRRYLQFSDADGGAGPFPAGEKVTVTGTGFCGSQQGCSSVKVTLDGVVVAEGVAVDGSGRFSVSVTAGDRHGLYSVSAQQTDGKGKQRGDRQAFIASVRDEEGEQGMR